jgi:hypothetical protein
MNPADNLFNLLIVETLAIHLVQQAFMTAIKDPNRIGFSRAEVNTVAIHWVEQAFMPAIKDLEIFGFSR